MIRAVAFVCLAAYSLGSPLSPTSGNTGRIVGGSDASILDYPSHLSFESGGTHFCGASIISADWALTAAHCGHSNVKTFTLRANTSLLESGGTVYQVAEKVLHPDYVSQTLDYDFALLRVETPFVFGPGVAAIGLPEQGELIPAGTMGSILGWGTQSELGEFSTILQAVNIPVVPQELCQADYDTRLITARMICAGYQEGGQDACQGDSGGPLIVNDKLAGVISWSIGCARPNSPGVNARVASVRNWITQNTGI